MSRAVWHAKQLFRLWHGGKRRRPGAGRPPLATILNGRWTTVGQEGVAPVYASAPDGRERPKRFWEEGGPQPLLPQKSGGLAVLLLWGSHEVACVRLAPADGCGFRKEGGTAKSCCRSALLCPPTTVVAVLVHACLRRATSDHSFLVDASAYGERDVAGSAC